MLSGKIVAMGRPPTVPLIGGCRSESISHFCNFSRSSPQPCTAPILAQNGKNDKRSLSGSGKCKLRDVRRRSEPGLADKAVEFAKEVLETDLSEVLDTVQTAGSDAVITTTEALQVNC